MTFAFPRQPSARRLLRRSPPPAAGGHHAMHERIAHVVPEYLRPRRRWLQLVGWPGIVGASLLTICPAFYLFAIDPARVRMEEARDRALSMRERVRIAAGGLGRRDLPPAEQLARFYRTFPKEKDMLPSLKKVFELADAQGIRLDDGEYELVREDVGKLARFRMTLPVRSRYAQLRAYLGNLRAHIPIVALEQLQFERHRVSDPAVNARLRLALYVEDEQ
jgi:hypothetical protein